MVHSCCMVGCTNKQNKAKGISLHRIPKYPIWRREAWINAINRLDPDVAEPTQWSPTLNSRVCSVHFLEGKPSEDPSDPDFVPTLNLTGKEHQSKVTESSRKRHERAKKRKQTQINATPERETPPSLVDKEDAAESLLELSQSSPLKKTKASQTLSFHETETVERLQKRIQQYEQTVAILGQQNAALERKLERIRLLINSLPGQMLPVYIAISKELLL